MKKSIYFRHIEKLSDHLKSFHKIEAKRAIATQSYHNICYNYLAIVKKQGVHPPIHFGNFKLFNYSIKDHMKYQHSELYVNDEEIFDYDYTSPRTYQ